MAITRRLSAIMFADIQGYTSLMQEDEASARIIRDKFQDILEQSCKAHHGRVAQVTGDGALCIFNSAIEAVHAAIRIQKFAIRAPKVPLRIGIHIGDVLLDGNNIYGSGVNIASRIESFAVAGSVLVSGKVHSEISNQKDISAVSLGKYDLKSTHEPLGIYAISNEGLEVPEMKYMKGKGIRVSDKEVSGTLLLMPAAAVVLLLVLSVLFRNKFAYAREPDIAKPRTIAVLPFSNLSTSKEYEYFADGICDQVLTQISKISGLNVMSRTTTLQFRDTKKTIREIGSEIGADVLLEGTVQKSSDKVRINVQLIDAKEDDHLWAETYDREMKDVFAIQTDIAKQIAAALNTTLSENEKSLIAARPTENLEAYEFYLKGNKYSASFWDYSKMEEVPQAIRMYEQAIGLDPKFTAAYSALVELYCGIYRKKAILSSDDYGVKAKECMNKMIALGANDSYTHNALAVYKFEKEYDHEGALSELNTVDQLSGSGKSTYARRAEILRRMGRIDEALQYLKMEAALFPKTGRLWVEIAETFKLKRAFDSSLYYINKAIETGPEIAGFYMNKSIYYAELKGDLSAAASVLRNASSLVDTNEYKPIFTYLELLQGDYDKALQRLNAGRDSLGILWEYKFIPYDLTIAILYHVQGREDLADLHFRKTYELASGLAHQYPEDFRMHAVLGIALAGLGEKERAIQEGNKASALMPSSKDVIVSVSPMESLALINTLLGEHDQAVKLLEQLLQMPFTWTMSNSIPLYKMNFYWKPLRSHPEFKKLIQS